MNLRADEHDEGDLVLEVAEPVCSLNVQLDDSFVGGLNAGLRRTPIPTLRAVTGLPGGGGIWLCRSKSRVKLEPTKALGTTAVTTTDSGQQTRGDA